MQQDPETGTGRTFKAAAKGILDELRQPTRDLREHIPAVFDGYGTLSAAVSADGALDAKTKDLIALAIAVAKQCDGCFASHARGAARRGATVEEVPRRWALPSS